MNRSLLLAALALACFASPALAGDPSAVVALPWGDMLKEALSAIEPAVVIVVGGVATAAIRSVSPVLGAFVSEALVDKVLAKWLDYGINAIPGAEKGGTLTVDVGSAVLATALQRGVDRAQASKLGGLFMKWAGGPEEAANKLFRMMKLEPKAGVDVLSSVLGDLRASKA